MKYKYTTKQGVFYVNTMDDIPWEELHSINDKPALENLQKTYKEWRKNGLRHRLNGPAIEDPFRKNDNWMYWINGKVYSFEKWCENHPDKTILAIYLLKL